MNYVLAEQSKGCIEPKGSTMKSVQTRFGEVEYQPENVLLFPEGLIGFSGLREFIVMPNEKQGPLFWVQSIEDADVAFLMTDPTNFFLKYRVQPDSSELEKLGVCKQDQVHVLSVVTLQQDRSITLNLQAPVLIAPRSNRALQVILGKNIYTTREPLPEVEKAEK